MTTDLKKEANDELREFQYLAMHDPYIREQAQTTINRTFLRELEDKFKNMRTTDDMKISKVWKHVYAAAKKKQDLILYHQLRELNRKLIRHG